MFFFLRVQEEEDEDEDDGFRPSGRPDRPAYTSREYIAPHGEPPDSLLMWCLGLLIAMDCHGEEKLNCQDLHVHHRIIFQLQPHAVAHSPITPQVEGEPVTLHCHGKQGLVH